MKLPDIRLPPGEQVLWQGRPHWRPIAARVFHVRIVILWFVALTLLDMIQARLRGQDGVSALRAAEPGALTGLLAVLILVGLAWATQRTTRYVITTGRVVMQFGVALPATLVLPLPRIAAASVRVHDDHTGDISLRLAPGTRIGVAKLWPHVRPWRLAAPEPMLRDVPQAGLVATRLCRALAELH